MIDAEFLRSAIARISAGTEEIRYAAVKDLARAQAPESVPLLMRVVGDSSYRVREEALNGICCFPPEVIFPRLEDFLRDNENANLRTAAIEAFPRYGAGATSYLLRLLKDYDEEVRMFAASILGEIQDPLAVENLIAALKDPDENVRHAAAESLGRCKDARAVGPLIDCLRQDFWIQYPAVIALGNIGDPAATLHLIGLLDDEMLRQAVIEALGKIGDVSAIPILTGILAHHDSAARNDAIASLVSIQRLIKPDGTCLPSIKKALDNGDLIKHLLASLQQPDLEVKKNAVIALGWLREPQAVASLVNLLPDYDLEEYVVGSLVSIGEAALPALVDGLKDPDPKIQLSLIRCLDWIGHRDGIKACLPFLQSAHGDVRCQAVLAMAGALNLEEVENALVRLLPDADPEIQGLLVEVLGRSHSERLIAKLLPELANAAPDARSLAVQIVGRLKSPAAFETLQRLLQDESDEVRAYAYKALHGIRDGRLDPEILLPGLRDKSPTVRKAVARCVPAGAEAIVNQSLLYLLKDPDPEVRLAAIETLGQIGDASCLEALVESFIGCGKPLRLAVIHAMGNIHDQNSSHFLADRLKENDPDLKRSALESMGRIKDKRSLPHLLVALDDADWSVRCSAVKALAQVGDPRLSGHLIEKLDDPEIMVRKETILALGQLGDRTAVPAILPLIHHDDLQVEALRALENLGLDDLESFGAFFRRSNTRLKCLLVDLLGRLREPKATDFLAAVLEDEFFTVRAWAAKALGESGDPRAIPALLKSQKQDPSEEVQKEAAAALKRLDARK